MEFLEQHKIMHGDLATRNILLAKEKTVAKAAFHNIEKKDFIILCLFRRTWPKICGCQYCIWLGQVADFGLSRSLYTSVEELATVSSGFPVRWMAPEVTYREYLEGYERTNIFTSDNMLRF